MSAIFFPLSLFDVGRGMLAFSLSENDFVFFFPFFTFLFLYNIFHSVYQKKFRELFFLQELVGGISPFLSPPLPHLSSFTFSPPRFFLLLLPNQAQLCDVTQSSPTWFVTLNLWATTCFVMVKPLSTTWFVMLTLWGMGVRQGQMEGDCQLIPGLRE